MVTDKDSASESQYVCNKTPALKKVPKSYDKDKGRTINETNLNLLENMINIQLPYDINQAIESNIWNGNFHLVSLHSSIEHLVSDAKNIKELLY